MEALINNEKVQYMSPALRMRVWKMKEMHINVSGWNYHDETEIVLILQGRVNFHIDNRVYRLGPGDAVLVGTSQLHAMRVSDENKLVEKIVLQFDLKHHFDPLLYPYVPYFQHIFEPLAAVNDYIRGNRMLNDDIFDAVLNIYNENEQQRIGCEISISLHLKRILLTLLRHELVDLSTPLSGETMMLFQPVLEYVAKHLSEPINLKQMSDLAGMSYYHFCRTFKKCLSMSFTEYVNCQRVKAAERLLLTTNATINDIAYRVGFNNVSHFFKVFQKVNHDTPRGFKLKLNDSINPVPKK